MKWRWHNECVVFYNGDINLGLYLGRNLGAWTMKEFKYIFPYDRIKTEKQGGLWQVWVEHQDTGDIEAFAHDVRQQKAIFKLGMDWARKNQ